MISDWHATGWLAAYGAAVGTVALLLNFVRLSVFVRRGRRRLRLMVCLAEQAAEYAQALDKPSADPAAPWNGGSRSSYPFWALNVANPGSVTVCLSDAGLLIRDRMMGPKHKLPALIRGRDTGRLVSLGDAIKQGMSE